MSIATEILSLRKEQSSSVKMLANLLEFQYSPQGKSASLYQAYAVQQATDLVLLNVAVHALEALDTLAPELRRAVRSYLRKLRRPGSPRLSQRIHASVRPFGD